MEQKAIVIDEAWQLIGSVSSPLAAEFLVEMSKFENSFNTSIIFASQDITDFFSLEGGKYGEALISSSKTKIILNLEPHEAEKCGKVLSLTETEIHKIKNFERGYGLLSSNGNNIAVHFQASELENSLITTDPEELRKIAEEKKQRTNPDGLRFATKKECASLLALLGEESWRNMKERGGKYHSVGWVRDRIMTVEEFEGNMFVRFATALHPDCADEVEKRMEEAAMREEGYYHFSYRMAAGFALAEITIYEIPEERDFILEYYTMREKLNEALED